MTEDELMKACEALHDEYDSIQWTDEKIEALLAFARRMQAVGVREASSIYWVKCGAGKIEQVDDFLDWCESEARRLEQP